MESKLFSTLSDKAFSDAQFVSSCISSEYLGVHNLFHDNIHQHIETFSKPRKTTILHEYIRSLLSNGHIYEDVIENLPRDYWEKMHSEELFNLFEFSLQDIGPTPTQDENEIAYAERVNSFYCDNINDQWADHVFYVLFSNKDFLFRFNSEISKIIGKLEKTAFPEYLSKNGVLYRCKFPVWLKKAVDMRDRNRCQLCGRDLTGTLEIVIKHYDHIIPLELGGANDPTNIQLTCGPCNHSKGARRPDYKNIMIPFW